VPGGNDGIGFTLAYEIDRDIDRGITTLEGIGGMFIHSDDIAAMDDFDTVFVLSWNQWGNLSFVTDENREKLLFFEGENGPFYDWIVTEVTTHRIDGDTDHL
jgi:hypothetical protein